MKQTKLKRRSKRQARIERQLNQIKTELYEADPRCSGCGNKMLFSQLDASHLIKRRLRPEFITDRRNIVLDCKGAYGCHAKWESWDKNQQRRLLNYDERIKRIMEMDESILLLRKDYEPPLMKAEEGEDLPFG